MNDLKYLRSNSDTTIYSVYTAGLAIECMFRAYITRYTKEFDSKHNLQKLFEKSQIANLLNQDEKEKLVTSVKSATKIWSNDLRYTSEKRLKRKLAHEFVKKKMEHKDFNKHIARNYSDLFDATELIVNTGKSKWI